jgi:predicted nucleic acid-binding protein
MLSTLDLPDTRYTRYLLDGNIIDLIFSKGRIVLANYERVDAGLVWIPSVVYVEKVRGLANLVHRYDRDEVKAQAAYDLFEQYCLFMDRHPILPYTDDARKQITSSGKIGAPDRRIAACADAHGFVVATRNRTDFERLLGPDWTVTSDDGGHR